MNIDWSYLVDQEQWNAKLAFVCKLRTTKHNNKAKAKQIARTLSSIPHALVSLVPLDWFAIITQEDFAYTLCAYLVRLFPSQHGMNFSSLSLWAVILLCPQEAINAKGDMLHDLLKCHHRSHWEKALRVWCPNIFQDMQDAGAENLHVVSVAFAWNRSMWPGSHPVSFRGCTWHQTIVRKLMKCTNRSLTRLQVKQFRRTSDIHSMKGISLHVMALNSCKICTVSTSPIHWSSTRTDQPQSKSDNTRRASGVKLKQCSLLLNIRSSLQMHHKKIGVISARHQLAL